jgi:hypothetical protein
MPKHGIAVAAPQHRGFINQGFIDLLGRQGSVLVSHLIPVSPGTS